MAGFILSPPLRNPGRAVNRNRVDHKPQRWVCERILPTGPKALPNPNHTRLSGEWAGYEAKFDTTGTVTPVPDYYIPEEFREWGIVPFGFECHTSVKVTESTIYITELRVLPSVSQFGDHVDTEEESAIVEVGHVGLAVFSDGCWVNGGEKAGIKSGKLEKWPVVDLFIRHGERGAGVRMRFNRAEGCVIDGFKVVLYDLVGDYADAGVLEGGSGYVTGWVERGGVVDVAGKWVGDDGVVVNEIGAVTLPGGVDVGVRLVDEGCLLWGAWTVDGLRIVLRRLYDGDGKLVYSERLALTRDS